jgi:hypothetical protein
MSVRLPQSPAAQPAHVQVRGPVGEDERDGVQAMISAVLRRHRNAVAHTRVRLTGGYCGGWPTLVQVNLRVCGAAARIQVAGTSHALAIAAAAARLDRQICRSSTAYEPWPWPDPQRRPLAVPIPGKIARLKTVRLHTASPCQAAAVLDAMDYDVHLFTDAETGQDAIVFRAGPTGLRLARQRAMHPPSLPVLLPLTVNSRKIPTLTASHAADRLAEHGLPFLFYTDLGTRRGHLLYRRYDGGLGLVTPRDSTP